MKDPAVISVISFNVRYNNPNDGINAWPNRKSMVSDFVRSINPDIMGLQELTHQQFLDVAGMFPEYSRSGVGRDDGKHEGEYAAILFKMDRFNLLEESTFWLSESPEDTGSISWGAHLPRIASWVRLEVKKTKHNFFVFNTHYSHISDSARMNSSKLILEKIEEIAGGFPVVLTGDFNFPAGTEGYSIITNGTNEVSGLADAQFKSNTPHFGGEATFNGFGKVKNGKKIDFIFVNPEIRVLQHGIYPIHDGDLYISDHYPVFTELEFLDLQVN
jgi:endonuclease/exonuclease/phosphatase family metal-dependent hydrolase